MKFLKPLLLIATTMMIVSAEIATAAGPIQASKRMLEYTYSKTDILFCKDIRNNAPEPRTQQEFEALHRRADEGGADSNYLLSDLYILETEFNAYYNSDLVSEVESKRRASQSLRFLQRSLDINPAHPLALNRAGVNYEMGRVVPKDMKKAVHYFDRAARSGNGVAAHRLFEIYMIGYDDISKDTAKAHYYADLAKELGSNFHKYTTTHWDETLKYYERFDKVQTKKP
ncbi:TPA: tetratricopeptide repeat protein [Pseudomonas aeruginosa]|uniref:tetratricopeptide repeat protein n=1 Tax=Pseudomonas aeruginosa TaxID=287 RepID=UPI001067B3B8|nr:SEL1-like repeat protein [Pseudomonas aeruginosa]TEH62791.1 sel1 repeat family protein [Pseudomonas aeruginosa]